MGALDLILELRSSGFSIQASGGYLEIQPPDKLPPEWVQKLKQNKADILRVLNEEARRQKVIAMLNASPDRVRAIYADTDSDPHFVILTIAVRSCNQTCEMQIDKATYDPWALLELIETCGTRTH